MFSPPCFVMDQKRLYAFPKTRFDIKTFESVLLFLMRMQQKLHQLISVAHSKPYRNFPFVTYKQFKRKKYIILYCVINLEWIYEIKLMVNLNWLYYYNVITSSNRPLILLFIVTTRKCKILSNKPSNCLINLQFQQISQIMTTRGRMSIIGVDLKCLAE